MKEDFISFIWKYRYFKKKDLRTTQNQSIEVINVGQENNNTGPDFFNAQIIIDDQKWAGNIEIHVNASDWYVHGHENDSNYDNVILHVVWENDASVYRKDNSIIPTFVLKNVIDNNTLLSYQNLFSKQQRWINCENEINTIDKFLVNNWLERLYFERLQQKSHFILELLQESNNDWEAVLFKLLLKNFGLKVNGEAFFEVAKVLDFSIIRKEAYKLESIEALLFGVAGLLKEPIEDPYYTNLQKEHAYLINIYQLNKTSIPVHFFRLRPNNFPTIRLSQLSNLFFEHRNLFSKLMEISTIREFYNIFEVTATAFWDTHYTFETTSKKSRKRLTKPFVDILIINTIIPLKFVYQKYKGTVDESSILKIIENLKPEKNTIINKFAALKIESKSSFETQALIQLKNEYCSRQKCLQCSIGNELLTS